jgi:hypothetical protein
MMIGFMARLRADFGFAVHSLWIERGALDTPVHFERNDFTMTLSIPWLGAVPMRVGDRLRNSLAFASA